MAYTKLKVSTTPLGIALWTCINKPSTKFKPQGEYNLDVAFDAATAEPMQAAFKAAAEAAKKMYLDKETDPKKKAVLNKLELHVPGVEELGEDGNPTGRIVFKFKQDAIITPKDKSKQPFEIKIGIFDGKNAPIPSTVLVGKGTELKVAYEIIPFAMAATKKVGVKLRLKAVQIIKLVKYGGSGNASDFGFESDDSAESYAPDATPTGTEGGEPTGGTGDASEF